MQNVLPLVVMLPVMYLLLIRPQKKRVEQQRQLVNSLEEGAEVMTGSGVYGFVHAVEGEIVWLEVAEGVIIRVSKAAVSRVVPLAGSTDSTTIVPAGGENRPDDDSSEKG